jgi:hypothetical protein
LILDIHGNWESTDFQILDSTLVSITDPPKINLRLENCGTDQMNSAERCEGNLSANNAESTEIGYQVNPGEYEEGAVGNMTLTDYPNYPWPNSEYQFMGGNITIISLTDKTLVLMPNFNIIDKDNEIRLSQVQITFKRID